MRKAIWVGIGIAALATVLGAGPVQAASKKHAAAAEASGDTGAAATPKAKKHHKKGHKAKHAAGDAAGMK